MITVKEEFLTDPKTVLAMKLGGSEAIHLWLAMKAHAASKLTNGFVPDALIDHLPGGPKNPRRALKALVDCAFRRADGTMGSGLVEKVNHGWQLHDYLDHANSADEELERRRKERERKAAYRETKKGRVPPVSHGTSGTDDGTSGGTETGTETGRPSPLACAPAARPRAPASPPHPTPPQSQPTPPPDPATSAVDSNEDPGRETACPLDLYDRAEQAGVHTELAGRLTVPIESLRQETREFVAYWTIGGGMGQRRTTWVARLRQRLVKRAGEGALKAPGAIAHAATKVAELGSPGAAVAPSKHLAGFVGDERGSS